MCFGARAVAGSAQCVLTSYAGPDTLVVRTSFMRNYAYPKEIAAVILGGGTGTQLFPLTSTRTTPAVPIGGCYMLIDISMRNCFSSGIDKIFVMTQFSSTSLNRRIHRTYLGWGINFTDGSVECVGFIGLGNMASHIARKLMMARYKVTVHDMLLLYHPINIECMISTMRMP